MSTIESSFLNIADLCPSTRALGPGLRAALWVQGCPIHCKGCIAPDWIPFKKAHRLTPEEAAAKLLQDQAIEGITISGGEPMLQAAGLTAMLRAVRSKKNLHVICFTGFRYEQLMNWNEKRKIADFFDEIDVLIDGPFVEELNDGLTFAGSSNQRIIELSNYQFPGMDSWISRRMEIHIRERNILAIGIPPIDWVRHPIQVVPKDIFLNSVEEK